MTLQEFLARTLDNISYSYMGTQRRTSSGPLYAGTIDEYMEREKIDDPVKFFSNPGVCPRLEITDVTPRSRYDIHKFKFDSFIETPHDENNTVYGRFYEQHGKPDAPTAIVLHGWRMESYLFFDKYCRWFINEGYNVALVDLPYHMNRRVANSFHGEFTFTDDAVFTLEVMRQSITDIMCVANWLKSRGAPRIGVFGVSYGALLSGILGCTEPSIDFMALIAPPADMGEVFAHSRLGRLFEKDNPKARKMMKQYKEILDRTSLMNLTPMMPKENIFIAEARFDGMVPVPVVEKLWRAWGRPTLKRYPHGHLSVILFNPRMDRDLRHWLRNLKT